MSALMSTEELAEQLCQPDMIYTVNPDPCHILNVTVVEAHKISKGWIGDLVDKPDPYAVLKVPGTLNGTKQTKYFNNDSSPTWNEEFAFILDPVKTYHLEVILMDANYTFDQKLGCENISLEDLVLNEEAIKIVTFGQGMEIHLKLLLIVDNKFDLRYSLCLCEQEKDFRRKRKRYIYEAIRRMYPDIDVQESQVPTIGVIASGGGFRAMTAFGGAMKALSDTKILDCVTYLAGLSGSAWYISTLYSHPNFPRISPSEMLDELRKNVRHSPFWLLSPRSMYRYISSIKAKYKNGQPVSFTDFFGHLLGDTLLKDRCDTKLSDQREKVQSAEVPLPFYTCLHVKSNVSAKVFQDWLEFSPYEIGIAKYAAFMKTEHFGSKLFKGRIVKKFPEYPLHFLQGVWGSAFSILFKRLIQDRTKLSIDLSGCALDESDDEEEEIFYDAVEEFQFEEDTLRDALDSLDLSSEDTSENHSDSEDEAKENDNGSHTRLWSTVRYYFGSQKTPKSSFHKEKNNSPSKKSSSKSQKDMLQPGFWKDFINNICASSIFDTRKGRAGRVLNPLRGLSLIPCFPFSPSSPTSPADDTLFKGLTEPAPTNSKTIYLVDSGLTFNLPFPILLRPERKVDLYLAFDFSSREADNSAPFKELLLAEKWAQINNCLFPPIHDLVTEYIKEPPKECYVFKHPTNELCPIIVHFPLFNLKFKKFKTPGVPRETEDELKFADFSIFSDPKKCYSIFNFKYPSRQFDRLSQLMEFNVLNNIDIVRENIRTVTLRKTKNLVPPSTSTILKDPPKK